MPGRSSLKKEQFSQRNGPTPPPICRAAGAVAALFCAIRLKWLSCRRTSGGSRYQSAQGRMGHVREEGSEGLGLLNGWHLWLGLGRGGGHAATCLCYILHSFWPN